jgi:RNA polymerase sigma factor (sigma-70 family)
MTASARRAEQRHREMLFAVIGRYLGRLHHYVRHLLAYLESTGAIVSGELTAEEVVDAVLLRAQEEFAKSPPTGRLRSWLIKLAQEELGTEVARLNAWRETTPVRTQQDVPETPPTERVSTLGEEILYFHEPDEDLKIEDVLPDLHVPTPEQVAEATDLAWCTEAALAGMPDRWRRTLLHHYVDGLTGDALARALGEPRANVHRTLACAREYLRQRMIDAGCAFRLPGERTRRRRPARPRAAARSEDGG